MTAPNHVDLLDREALLDEAVASFLQAEAEGKAPNRLEWLARYNEVNSELREFYADRDGARRLLAPLQAAVRVARGEPALTDESTKPQLQLQPRDLREAAAAVDVPRFLGDYEILDCLGLGGGGIVYKAWQHRLNRPVAVKRIRLADRASSEEIARFRNEAEFIAQLAHPGIVPIYDVGESEGQPYFAMRLIEGGNLQNNVDRYLDDSRSAAELVMKVAEAIHHAHQRGILHRDLKPSNILLDGDHNPLVTDFGLAKRLRSPEGRRDDDELTRPNVILGTPSYLAPEQARGKGDSVTTATDVHGLGAILYVLLTGRPPFAGESVLDTLEQVRGKEPARPRRLRSRVPADLETICLKCLAKEPGRRYASAAHLAEDLCRFLDGRPIQAQPRGPARRLMDWARRNPASACLAATPFIAGVVIVGLTMSHQRRLESALRDSRSHALEAQRRKEEVSINYRRARETIERMIARTQDPRRGELPRMVELRRGQQQDALEFLLQIAAQQGDDLEVLSDVADARMLAARVQYALGQVEEARTNARIARDLLAALVERVPDAPSHAQRLAYAWLTCGVWHPDKEPATASIKQALILYENLDRIGVDVKSGLAMAHHNLGERSGDQGDPAEAESHWRTALELHQHLHRTRPEVVEHRRFLASSQSALSLLLQSQASRLPEAEALHDQAEANLQVLLKTDPNDLESLSLLAQLHINWAYTQIQRKESSKALRELGENEETLRSALQREPNVVSLQVALFRTLGTRATILEALNRLPEALSDYEEVVAFAPPSEKDVHRVTLAILRGKAGDHARALADVEALLSDLPAETPWKRWYRLIHACSHALAALEADPRLEPAVKAARVARCLDSATRLLDRACAGAGKVEWNRQASSFAGDFPTLWSHEAIRRRLEAR